VLLIDEAFAVDEADHQRLAAGRADPR
jgi:hypothetical protein